jgi:hypothetical protein
VALNRRIGIDDLQLLFMGSHLELVARYHRNLREQSAFGLPAFAAAAGMIVRGFAR